MGITPAHAGKSCRVGTLQRGMADHPRTRGEKRRCYDLYVGGEGSPPHTRGKAPGMQCDMVERRITPAHAGKSPIYALSSATKRDHPRTRGEKEGRRNKWHCQAGSPPHTRGKASRYFIGRISGRITPAHAGKSLFLPIMRHHTKDHPRTRGEKKPLTHDNRGERGSPPHTRGKVVKKPIPGDILRITPAHAGKS